MTLSELVPSLLALVSGVAGTAVGYGLTLGRIRTVERDVERLERTSASKEGLDAMKATLESIRIDMDRRFDQLEKLLLARTET